MESWRCALCEQQGDQKGHSPRLLQCGHSFCLVCLESLADHSSAIIRCPEGHPPTPIPLGLASLPELNFLITSSNLIEDTTNRLCDVCAEPDHFATHFCRDCSESLCETALAAHKLMKKYHQHVVVPSSDVQVITPLPREASCPEHDENFIAYDNECQRLVCGSCTAFGSHRGHLCSGLPEARALSARELPGLIESAMSRVGELERREQDVGQARIGLAQLSVQVQTQINDLFAQAQSDLDARKATLLEQLRHIQKEHEFTLNDQSKCIQNLLASSRWAIEAAKSKIDSTSAVTVVAARDHLKRSNTSVDLTVQLPKISFSVDRGVLDSYRLVVGAFGTLTTSDSNQMATNASNTQNTKLTAILPTQPPIEAQTDDTTQLFVQELVKSVEARLIDPIEAGKEIANTLNARPSLTSLNLFDQGVSILGAKALAEVLRENRTLNAIDLRRNRVGDEGANLIAEAISSNKKIKAINLWRNEVSTSVQSRISKHLEANREKR